MTECEELERKCVEYAKMQNALYYYEKPPGSIIDSRGLCYSGRVYYKRQ